MPDRTGRALGTLDPVIFFENSSGHILLPGIQIGEGPSEARRMFESRYKAQGYEWREAGTWTEVQRLQKRLVEQETRILQQQGQVDAERRARVHRETSSNLRARMASGDCDPWERDFIAAWLQLREEKQAEYTKRFTERNMYLYACEFDANSKVEDRIK
jgi:hypothetical protein